MYYVIPCYVMHIIDTVKITTSKKYSLQVNKKGFRPASTTRFSGESDYSLGLSMLHSLHSTLIYYSMEDVVVKKN